ADRLSDRIRAAIATSNFGEQVKLNRSLQGCRALVSVQVVEDDAGIGFVGGRSCCGHRLAILHAPESSADLYLACFVGVGVGWPGLGARHAILLGFLRVSGEK